MAGSFPAAKNCNFCGKDGGENNHTFTQQPVTETIADKLEKLKRLLDTGAITKEEYEKAKKTA